MKSYRDPNAQWLGSPNYWPDREGHDMAIPPAYVIIHTIVGTIQSADGRFQQNDPVNGASAHYGVGMDGRLVQWVDEMDAAWHAGNRDVNLDSVGIEHEDNGFYDDPRPDALYESSARLVRSICLRYGLPIDRDHIRAHREVSLKPTACPDALDVDRIVTMAAQGDDMTETQAAQLQRVFDILDTIPAQRTGGNAGDLLSNVYLQLRSLDGVSVPGDAETVLTRAASSVDVETLATAIVAKLPPSALTVDQVREAVRGELATLVLKAVTT